MYCYLLGCVLMSDRVVCLRLDISIYNNIIYNIYIIYVRIYSYISNVAYMSYLMVMCV